MTLTQTVDDFAPHVGKSVTFPGAPATLTLDRVEAQADAPPPGMRTPFLVIFAGPRGAPLMPEGFYLCQVEGGPAFELYVQPIHTPHPARQEYQASFN